MNNLAVINNFFKISTLLSHRFYFLSKIFLFQRWNIYMGLIAHQWITRIILIFVLSQAFFFFVLVPPFHILIFFSDQKLCKLYAFRNAFGLKFVGCPVCIDNPKYKRNALIFNLNFVFSESTNTASYGAVVKKLAGYMIQLEVCLLGQSSF